MKVENEAGVVVLFAQLVIDSDWTIDSIRTEYPDATLKNGNGRIIKVEFEYKSSNFIRHKHNPKNCDVIICYENDLTNCPMPIWELKNDVNFDLPDVDKKDIYIWFLENEVRRLRKKSKVISHIHSSGISEQEKRQNYIINAVRARRKIVLTAIANELDTSRQTISKDVNSLIDNGIIKKENGKYGEYSVI